MIKSFLICDSQGYPFYQKKVDEDFEMIDPNILSGLISAIASTAKKSFHKELATISFGDKEEDKIMILSKELFGLDKSIYFVFYVSGDIDVKKAQQLCTNIFIETKQILKNPHANSSKVDIDLKIDRLLESRYDLKQI